MINFIKNNVLNFIIAVLLLIIFLDRCNDKPVQPQVPKVVRDTTWVVKESFTTTRPQVVKTIEVHDSIITKEYLPDTNYAKLVVQYQEVVNQLLAQNILKDSIRIDSVGYVKIIDTVKKNLIVGRSVQSAITYPIIKETITLPAKKTNQLYLGGAILGNPAPIGIMGSALLKTRNDFMFGGSLSVSPYGVHYGIHLYQKIKLRRHE